MPKIYPASHTTPQTAQRSRRRHGFTLVELMVSMALLGLLTSIIYGLFHNTSQTLSEVDSLTETTDIARFALEHVRNDLQAVGSQASPNTAIDPWAQPKSFNFSTLLPYSDWKATEVASFLPSDLATANPQSRYDGIVLIGAYDIPQSVLLSNVQTDRATIAGHARGITRLFRSDPFDISPTIPSAISDLMNNTDVIAELDQAMQNRLLRVTDRQGYFQFATIDNTQSDAFGVAAIPSLRLTFSTKKLAQAIEGSPYGIDLVPEADAEYEAAFLDGFWYHVIPDPFDSTNFQLVRDRINLTHTDAITGITTPQNWDPQAASEIDGTPIERVVIANNVVDFQLWFDCADATTGQVPTITWDASWTTPTAANMNCFPGNPHLAKVAHIRLSIRTANERANRPHLTIVNGWSGFEDEEGRMQTYDIAPSSVGAAAVVTVQTTVELTNFATRNLRATP